MYQVLEVVLRDGGIWKVNSVGSFDRLSKAEEFAQFKQSQAPWDARDLKWDMEVEYQVRSIKFARNRELVE